MPRLGSFSCDMLRTTCFVTCNSSRITPAHGRTRGVPRPQRRGFQACCFVLELCAQVRVFHKTYMTFIVRFQNNTRMQNAKKSGNFRIMYMDSFVCTISKNLPYRQSKTTTMISKYLQSYFRNEPSGNASISFGTVVLRCGKKMKQNKENKIFSHAGSRCFEPPGTPCSAFLPRRPCC